MRQILHVGASLLFIVAVTLACKRSRHHEDDYTTSTPPEVDTETTPTPTVVPTHSATASAHHTTTPTGHTQSAADAPCPGPGITRRCSGTCVNIQTDDNNCGECGNRCSDGKHCDGHLFCRDSEGNL